MLAFPAERLNRLHAEVRGETTVSALAEPSLCAQKYDEHTDRVLFVGLTEADYKNASFLDDRILKPGMNGFWAEMPDIEAARIATTKSLRFIFHTGHVGSTLLSRLLSETPSVLPLREPLPLRTLASLNDELDSPHTLLERDAFQKRLRLFLALWSRGFAHTETVLLKATSTAGRLAPVLLAAAPDAKAVYLNIEAEPYIATLLAGANAIIDLKGHAQERNRRLERLLGQAPLTLSRASVGELAAMAWLAETMAQRATGNERVMMFDFEHMLAAPGEMLAVAAAHLGVPAPSPSSVAAIMSRYSKGPEHAYSPALRAQLLAQARREHGGELSKGLAWIETTAKRFNAAARALE